jgi:hypothetical protein
MLLRRKERSSQFRLLKNKYEEDNYEESYLLFLMIFMKMYDLMA